ncbi:MAG: excinuclease ABC subunit UvrA [Angelakisella sp.]
MGKDKIIIKGARENNLKNVDLVLPRDQLIVFTGLSGSGKTSLAFDTIYADGQRRYVESLSSYARQFLGQMDKPDVDYIEGLSPAISIDQKTTSKNPRSTVGTVTEVYDYLRLLYARVGIPHCPICGKEIMQQTVDQIVDKVMNFTEGTKLQILAPVVRQRKGEHQKEFDAARRSGYVRVRVDGNIYELTESIVLEKNKKHTIEIVVDRLVVRKDMRSRLADSVETASALAGGLALINIIDGEDILFSQNYACPDHDVSIEELAPRMFSFNNPYGACEKCTGLGVFQRVDPELLIRDRELSIKEGAIRGSGWNYQDGGIAQMYFDGLSKAYDIPLDIPIKDVPPEKLNIIFFGTKGEKFVMQREIGSMKGSYKSDFEGVVNNLERRYKETNSEYMRFEISNYMSAVECPVCHGDRLKKIILAVTVGGKNISEICRMSVSTLLEFVNGLQLTRTQEMIAGQIIKEIKERLGFLVNVGLEYLTLARSSGTLSGGESQRIRLATQIGSSLVGVLYILDEPSIGLHQRDNDRLIATLKRLRDIGNTVIVVEHDEDTMAASDFIVDVGPGAGIHGGEIIYAGTPDKIVDCPQSITGRFLSGKESVPVPKMRRKGSGEMLTIRGAAENNLKEIDVAFPLGTFIAVTGVSGSGKSSLVNEILYKGLNVAINKSRMRPGKHRRIEGMEYLDKIIDIDQSPIGRTPRSNPATYTGTFNDIREVFASTNDAKMRGYKIGRFSFNVKGGRCEACEGDGILKIEMHFLPDVFVPCEVCKGRRYNRETLEVKYKGKSIHDVLEMTVEEALEFFQNHPKISRKLQTLYDVGLGYIKVGQSATTLSGGEAQRVKLATELSKRGTGKTMYILDEPTTGLHAADVKKLIEVLQKFVDNGNTVVVIEHNMDVIKTADYLVDLGPEGGDKGGSLVFCGTPEKIIACEKSFTGRYLKKYLK